ncbi:MAG: N-acetylmuramoyl-L-alanine amidase [Anaerolineales bacterium]|nr:N-acetylmuramoyl-L-alanine amidase [Anaerolineales bacterium]
MPSMTCAQVRNVWQHFTGSGLESELNYPLTENKSNLPVTEQPTPSPELTNIPEVIPERHIAPEFPEGAPSPAEQPPKRGKARPAIEQPTFMERTRAAPAGKARREEKRPPKGEPPVQHTGAIRQLVRGRKASAGRVKAPVTPTAPKVGNFPLVTAVSALRSFVVAFAAAVIIATIFMWWTSPDFLPTQARRELAPIQATAQRVVSQPTALPTPQWFNRIGIVAGHSGPNRLGNPDPGAVCADGFNELTVTTGTAERLAAMLRGKGFTVDILGEFDTRRMGYEAAAYISLHADSCGDFGYGGFKSTYPGSRQTSREADERLNECVRQNYAAVTGLEFQPGNITANMLEYHHWKEIAPTTPAIILELGFLSYDRSLLQNQQDKVALGIMNGLICFLTPIS